MPTEISRPTTYTPKSPAYGWTFTETDSADAYDTSTDTNAEHTEQCTAEAATPSCAAPYNLFSGFPAKTKTYTALNLIALTQCTTCTVHHFMDMVYSIDNGVNWSVLRGAGARESRIVTTTIGLDPGQDLTQVKVAIYSEILAGVGTITTRIYDIRLEGTYTAANTGFLPFCFSKSLV